MSRRFSDEPIHIIRRIPSPEQLETLRPAGRPLRERFGEAAASFVRAIAQRLVSGPRSLETMEEADLTAQAENREQKPGEVAREEGELLNPGSDQGVTIKLMGPTMKTDEKGEGDIEDPIGESSGIQPEELAELRGYLLQQQQDIGRLVAQVKELKTLVLSQQRLIEHLTKAVFAAPVSPSQAVPSSAVSGQGRSGRLKSARSGKGTVATSDSPRLPLNV
ncbi:MAG: hypothetical protein NZM29_06525 [Nitrospira sp.]|nr:hypothetical protein [Nitrospira sp.]